jgi:hypothetical protein
MKERIEIAGDWKSAALVAIVTLALPFSLVACLWRIFDVAHIVDPNAPSLDRVQAWAALPFMILAATNAGVVYAPRTRLQKWVRLLGGTLGMVVPFAFMELTAFFHAFESEPISKHASSYFMAPAIYGIIGMALVLGLCHFADLLVQWIRTRRDAESAHLP